MEHLIEKLDKDRKFIISLSAGIMAVSGTILLLIFFLSSSEAGNQVFLGLSAGRLVVGMFFLFLLLINITALIMLQKERYRKKTEDFIERYSLPLALSLYIVCTAAIVFFLLSQPSMARVFHAVSLIQSLENLGPRIAPFVIWLILASAISIITIRYVWQDIFIENKNIYAIDSTLKIAAIFVGTFFIYTHFAFLIDWVGKTKSSFFDLLAESFLQERLYLPNPLYTHDLTLYEGRWYVPMPPLPAIMLVPVVYFLGVDGVSTSYVSIFFSALNGVLLYLSFQQLKQRGWLLLSNTASMILVGLLLFGTPHLWVGISGRGWFLSQIMTVFFLTLSIYAALREWHSWWIGIFVGLAMLARPTAILTTPFLLAIHVQIMYNETKMLKIPTIIMWIIKVSLPILISIGLLLTYNYLRFDNIFDFGYATINGDPVIVQNVQEWGTFSPHFIPTNLKVMFLKLPFWNPGGRWPILPSSAGMSIFLTTPAFIYLFRRYPKDWWVIGAWGTIFLNVVFLIMYHNTGAHQFGYRYILDYITPLILLLGFSLEKKITWHFLLLTLFSIAINFYGTNWFMNG